MPRVFKPLNAGDLRFVGDLEKVDAGTDSAGSPLATYSPFVQGVRFSIGDWRVSENVQAATVLGQRITILIIRWRPGLEGVLPNVLRLKHISDYSVSPPTVDYYDIQGAIRDSTTRWALQLFGVQRDSEGYRTGITQ